MLKLMLKPGEFIEIGDEIRVVFSGGSANNIHLLIDAPRSYGIARSGYWEKHGKQPKNGAPVRYKGQKNLSPEAKEKITAIIKEDRWKNGAGKVDSEQAIRAEG